MVDLNNDNVYSPIGSFILLDKIEYFSEKQSKESYQVGFIMKLLKVRELVKKTLMEIKLHLYEATLQVTNYTTTTNRTN